MKYGLVFLVALMTIPAHADEASQKVIDCMRANLPSNLRAQVFEFVSADRSGGTRLLRGKVYAKEEKGLLRLMMRVQDPYDLAGSAYLLRETPNDQPEEIYLFLPGIKRVKGISGLEAGQSLFGTDFSYSDIRQIQIGFSGGESNLEEPTEIENRPVHVLVQKPKSAKTSPYNMTRSWVDKESCVIIKAEFHEAGQPRKLLSSPVSALTKSGRHWYLAEMEMRDLKEETKTDLKVQLVEGEKDLSQFYFSPNTFGIISN